MLTKIFILVLIASVSLVQSASINRSKRQYSQQKQVPVQQQVVPAPAPVPAPVPAPLPVPPPIVPPMVMGGGSPIIDLLLLGTLFSDGGFSGFGGGRRGGRYGRDIEPIVHEAEALDLEEPTSEHEFIEQTKTGERVKRQLIGGGLLSPLSPMGVSPLIDLLLLGSLYGNWWYFFKWIRSSPSSS
jgi:hypothetical protein